MKKMYKGYVVMNDGAKNGTIFMGSEAEVKQRVRETMKLTTRYFKKDGVDYGAYGKVFTYEEEHGGLKELTIVEFTETDRKVITEL